MRRRNLIFIVLAFIALMSERASGQTPNRAIARCAAIESPTDRLKCYDDLAKAAGVDRPKVTTPATKGAGKWVVRQETSPIDDSKNVFVTLDADAPVASRFGRAVRPSLVIRCKESKTTAYIDWGSYLGLDETQVLTRIDDAPASKESWSISTDHEATFAESPISLIKSLLGKTKLLAQVTPYGESPVLATFSIAGLENGVASVRSACAW
jgi:type VI secretion system protein VasI